jgi:arylsulfatase A-like enzyme
VAETDHWVGEILDALAERGMAEDTLVIVTSDNGSAIAKLGAVLGDGSGGWTRPTGEPGRRPFQLYDLASDPGEETSLVESHPEIARRLEEALAGIPAEPRPDRRPRFESARRP